MKKKLLISIFSVIAISASALTVVAYKNKENESKCEHNYGAGVITSEATCETDGVKLYSCDKCNEEYTEAISAIGHTNEEMEGVAATCTDEGKTDGVKCSTCDKVIVEPQVLAALGHNPVEDEAVEATCTEDGLTAGKHCERCDVVLEAQEIVPALGHTHVETMSKEPTCTEDGITAGSSCSTCGVVFSEETVIPAMGHKEIITQEAVDATCTQEGKTKGTACSVCGEVLQASVAIPALGHKVAEDEAAEATCTENGLTAGTHCTRCDVVLEAQEIIPALGHNEIVTQEAVDATCTQEGKTIETACSVCGEVLQASITIPVLGHKPVEDETKEATCTEDGLTAGIHCELCDVVLEEQEIIPALGHNEQTTDAVAPTCTESGMEERRECLACGQVLGGDVIPALGHTAEVVKGYAATCTDEGKTDGEKCSVCNEALMVQKAVAALGHNDENKDNVCDRCDEKLTATAGMLLMPVVKGESMSGNWYRIYRAESSYDIGSLHATNDLSFLANSVSYGYYYDAYLFHSGPMATLDGLEVVYTDEYIDLHITNGTYTIIGNGTVTSETVTIDENIKVSSAAQNVFRLVDEKYCLSNGSTHNFEIVKGYAATCTESGLTDGEKCSDCGAFSRRQEIIPMVAHTEVIVNKVDATCLSYGSTERKECSICGMVVEDSEILIPTGHTNKNGDEACDICGMKVKEADALTDHSDFVEVAVVKGDFVAGKWYRIYRDESMLGCYIDLSTDENFGYLVAYDGNSSYKNATYFYSGPLYIIKGMKFVYTDEYIDFYLEEGVYEIMHHTTGESTGKTLTIDETTTITGFTSGKCFELKQVI